MLFRSQGNAGYAVKCAAGGYVDGPLGTLAGAKGAKDIDKTCADRITAR